MTDLAHATPFALGLEPETGVATLTWAAPGGVNKIDNTFATALGAALDRLAATPGLRGLVLTSGHAAFSVGADLDQLARLVDPAQVWDFVAGLHAALRRLETLGVPVACALGGAALGGGLELALSAHHRVALDHPDARYGLPEVGLGLIPGAGGTQRLPRLIGLQRAVEHITAGAALRAAQALALGLVDALAPTREATLAAARQWVLDHPEAKRQPWDRPGFTFPGPAPGSAEARNLFMGATAAVFSKTAGTMPHVEAAVSAIQEGAGLTFERALEVERRYFVRCAVAPQAKAMIRTLWTFRRAAQGAGRLPRPAVEHLTRVSDSAADRGGPQRAALSHAATGGVGLTARLEAAYLLEAALLVAEGHDPVLVEWSARTAGMATPPLALWDERSLAAGLRTIRACAEQRGEAPDATEAAPALALLRALAADLPRAGEAAGGGFYEGAGPERRLRPGLARLAGGPPAAPLSVAELAERLLLAQVAEAVRGLDEGVVSAPQDVEIAAVFGLDFPTSAGGPLGWIDQRGPARVVASLAALAAAHGPRFAPPARLTAMATHGERFFAA